jgi:ABC-2 type transport system permease protein
MSALAIMYIFIFKGLGNDIEQFKVFIGNFPDVVKKALNIYLESISTLVGFYSFVFPFVVLCGAIQAMNLGTGIVSKELREKTADFLMTKPVRRDGILSSKLAAAIASLAATNIIYLALTVATAIAVGKDFDLKLFMLLSTTLFYVQLMFLSIGTLVSVIAGKIKSVISVSLSTVFGFYIIGTLGSVIGDDKVRYMSPFRYFDAAYIVKNAAYEPSYALAGIIIIAALLAVSYVVYVKKDVHAV